jgi:hypothetical protein
MVVCWYVGMDMWYVGMVVGITNVIFLVKIRNELKDQQWGKNMIILKL